MRITLPPSPPLELDDIDLETDARTIDLRADYRPEKPRYEQDLWRESILLDIRRKPTKPTPKRVLPRRKRSLGEKIANLYCRIVGRPH